MATIRNGIHGMISGRIGSLVFCDYRGKQVVKSLPRRSKKQPSVAQQSQRLRFSVVCNFSTLFKGLIAESHKKFVSDLLKNVVIGTYPDFELDYSKVAFTKGILMRTHACVCASRANHLNFTWEYCRHFLTSPSDQAILIVYNPAKHRSVWLKPGITRDAQAAELPIPESFSGDTLHCWIAFVSQDEKQYSTSSYLGTVVNHLKIN